jgi:ferredoxin
LTFSFLLSQNHLDKMIQRQLRKAALVLLSLAAVATAFTPSPLFTPIHKLQKGASPSSSSARPAVASNADTKGQGYTPKWVKLKTLAEELGTTDNLGFDKVGLKGTIPVVFKQGNGTKTSMAWAGQSYRDVASQAGQFVMYGCGKGECGTCECLVNGKWIRPCVETVPATAQGEQVVVTVKERKVQGTPSSGKFFSLRSFIMGFWNNLLGIIGMFKFSKAAKKNWSDRQEYENKVRQKTLEKKMKKG